MPVYNYIIKDPTGKTITGTVEAPDITLAGDILRERKYVVISLTEKKEGGLIGQFLERFRGVKLSEKTVSARQLATMVSAGLPLTNALEILRVQSTTERMQEVLGGMLADVQGGSSLAKSMSKYPDVFDKVTVSLVEAGEASGKLDLLLTQLADNIERERDFQSKTRGALVYPAVIGVAMLAVFIIMMVFVVPRLAALYADIGAELPLPTKILIGISNILYRDAILGAKKQVEKGFPLSIPIRADPNFDPLISQMIAVGEETGKLDEVLEKVAKFFESQAEQSVKNLSTALEPAILIVLGVMVGGLVLSIITPIYNLTTQF